MKYKKIVIMAVALVLLVALSFLLLRSCSYDAPIKQEELFEDENAVNIHTSDNNISGGDYIAIPGFERLTVSAGAYNIGCNIYNPEKNACYFVAVVSLDDGGEIFRSGLIAPGKAIYNMNLSEPLPPGEHNATLTYYCYTLDNKASLNGATTHFILEVKE